MRITLSRPAAVSQFQSLVDQSGSLGNYEPNIYFFNVIAIKFTFRKEIFRRPKRRLEDNIGMHLKEELS